jgi:hypothetical protein
MTDRAQPVWRQNDDVLTRRTSRSLLIVTPTSDEPLVLEGAAVSVWDALRQPATDDELIATIANAFAVTGDDVRSDVVATREVLHRQGALVGTDD